MMQKIDGTSRINSEDRAVWPAREYVELGGEFYADVHECGL